MFQRHRELPVLVLGLLLLPAIWVFAFSRHGSVVGLFTLIDYVVVLSQEVDGSGQVTRRVRECFLVAMSRLQMHKVNAGQQRLPYVLLEGAITGLGCLDQVDQGLVTGYHKGGILVGLLERCIEVFPDACPLAFKEKFSHF